jgi:hypothetical protein
MKLLKQRKEASGDAVRTGLMRKCLVLTGLVLTGLVQRWAVIRLLQVIHG